MQRQLWCTDAERDLQKGTLRRGAVGAVRSRGLTRNWSLPMQRSVAWGATCQTECSYDPKQCIDKRTIVSVRYVVGKPKNERWACRAIPAMRARPISDTSRLPRCLHQKRGLAVPGGVERSARTSSEGDQACLIDQDELESGRPEATARVRSGVKVRHRQCSAVGSALASGLHPGVSQPCSSPTMVLKDL